MSARTYAGTYIPSYSQEDIVNSVHQFLLEYLGNIPIILTEYVVWDVDVRKKWKCRVYRVDSMAINIILIKLAAFPYVVVVFQDTHLCMHLRCISC
jgi:hypothetical protein